MENLIRTKPIIKLRKLGNYYKAFFDSSKALTLRDLDENVIWKEEVVPELLDISITKKCNFKCPYCYQSAGEGMHMTMEDFEWLLDFMGEDKPFQVALGGGEVICNPWFKEMLKKWYENGVVPNYTTNGYTLLDEDAVKATIKYCGGVALTYHWHDLSLFKQALEVLTKLPIQRNIHLIVGKPHVNKLESVIEELKDKVDAIVLLEFHDIGRGNQFKDWKLSREDKDHIKKLLLKYGKQGKLAVGASLIPLAIETVVEDGADKTFVEQFYYNPESLLTGYVNEQLQLAPSSFWTGEKIDLKQFKSFREAYNSPLMKELRKKQYELRKICDYAYICNGGMHAECCKDCRLKKALV